MPKAINIVKFVIYLRLYDLNPQPNGYHSDDFYLVPMTLFAS